MILNKESLSNVIDVSDLQKLKQREPFDLTLLGKHSRTNPVYSNPDDSISRNTESSSIRTDPEDAQSKKHDSGIFVITVQGKRFRPAWPK
jgi:hypothetical protein